MPQLSPESKARVEAILKRAIDDILFRERYIADPESAISEYQLDEHERSLLVLRRRVALEESGIDVRTFREVLRDNGFKATPR